LGADFPKEVNKMESSIQGNGVENDSQGSLDTSTNQLFAGYLERRTGTGLGKRWKKRYFVIEPHALVEYRNMEGASSKTFSFKEMADILTEDRDKFTFGFRFATSRWVTLRASSANDLDDWVANLRRAIINQSPPTPVNGKKASPPTANDRKILNGHSGASQIGNSNGDEPAEKPQADLIQRRGKDSIPKLSIIVNDPKSRANSDGPPSVLRKLSTDGQVSPGLRRSMESVGMLTSPTAHGDDHSSDDDVSSSNSDEEDYDFNKKREGAQKPKATWGTSLRSFFSSSAARPANDTGSLDEQALDSDEEGSEVLDKKKVLDINTVQVVEYDTVEIFENQRWFPLSGWGTKMLPHDRALWTNRSGHSRTDWYRSSLDEKDTLAANTATLGTEDRDEVPGPQVHVIKEPWQWEGPWRLAPLSTLNPTHGHPHNVHPQQQSKMNGDSESAQKDTFKEGLRKDLRTGSMDSQFDGSSTIPEDGTVVVSGPPPPPTPRDVASPGVPSAPPSTKSTMSTSVVRSLKKRFHMGGDSSSYTSNQSVQSAPPLLNNHGSAEVDHPHHHPDGWAHAFDFPEFDANIARGVTRGHPPFASNNVRTRRWVRLRRRVINVTGRLPTNVISIAPSILSFQRQVVAEGWLGVKGRAGQWRSKYYKLVRLCAGLWDAGLGEGLVESPPTAYILYACECKELHQHSTKSLRLESMSMARANPVLNELALSSGSFSTTSESLTHSGVLTLNRFAPVDNRDSFHDGNTSGIVPAGAQPRELAEEPPRSGRFELALSKDHVFLFNADTREDALAWVSAINRAAAELQRARGISSADVANNQETALKLHSKRKSILRNFNVRKKRYPKDAELEDDEEAEKEDGQVIHLEDTGEDPQEAPETTPPVMTTEFDSKLKEVVNVTLSMSLRTFFQTFVGEKARFSIMDFHNEVGDQDVKCSSWNEAPPGGRQGRDEFDLEGYGVVPERLLTFKTATGAPIGPSVTRVEKHQRYFYFAKSKLLVVKTWARSLDVPFGDSFLVMEKWIVQPDKDDELKVNVRVISGAHFNKSTMLKGTIQKSVESGGHKIYLIWRKKFLHFGGARQSAAGANDDAEESAGGGQQAQSLVSRVGGAVSSATDMLGPVVQSSSRYVLMVFALWYLMQFLWTLQRIAQALEASDNSVALLKSRVGGKKAMDSAVLE